MKNTAQRTKNPHIDHSKIAHMVGVAEYMRENAAKYNVDPDTAYVVGLLHDIGYLKGKKDHAANGAEMLAKLGVDDYQIIAAIEKHGSNPRLLEKMHKEIGGGTLLEDYPLLCLTYEADMSIDTNGNDVGFEERLKDIGSRYGFRSGAYETAEKMISFVKNNLKEIKKAENVSMFAEHYRLYNETTGYAFMEYNELIEREMPIDMSKYSKISVKPLSFNEFTGYREQLLNDVTARIKANGGRVITSDVIVIKDGDNTVGYYIDRTGYHNIGTVSANSVIYPADAEKAHEELEHE